MPPNYGRQLSTAAMYCSQTTMPWDGIRNTTFADNFLKFTSKYADFVALVCYSLPLPRLYLFVDILLDRPRE